MVLEGVEVFESARMLGLAVSDHDYRDRFFGSQSHLYFFLVVVIRCWFSADPNAQIDSPFLAPGEFAEFVIIRFFSM